MRSRVGALPRAWGASGLATLLAVFTHQLAGGHTPSPVLVSVAWALGAVAALPFVGRRPSLLRLAGLLLPAQLVYHLAFGAGHAGHAAHASSAPLTVAEAVGADAVNQQLHAGHAGHAGALGAAHLVAATEPGAALMLAAHVLAALLSVLALRHAERGLSAAALAVSATARAAGRLFARLPQLPAAARTSSRVPATAWLPRPHRLGLPLAALRYRGPPLSLA